MKKFFFPFILLFAYPLTANIRFERPNKVRLAQEIVSYQKERRRTRFQQLAKHSTLGIGGLAVAGTTGYFLLKDSGDTQGVATAKQAPHGFLAKTKDALVLSVALTTAGFIVNSIFSLGSYLFDGFRGKKIGAAYVAFPYRQRLDNNLMRIKLAMQSLHGQEADDVSFQFHLAELVGSFSLFIRSLEKCCAVITVELKAHHKQGETVVQDWAATADRLLAYCDTLAIHLQNDFVDGCWEGFGQQTLSLLGGLKPLMMGAFGEITQMAGDEHEDQ